MDTMNPVDEYKALRDDLLYVLKSRDQFLLYTLVVTAAIWGWAFTKFSNNDPGTPFIFLLPLAVIIPNMFFYASQVRTGKKIGSYLHVFHETKERPGWERRSGEFNKLPNEFKSPHESYTMSFLLLGSICIIIFAFKSFYILISSPMKVICNPNLFIVDAISILVIGIIYVAFFVLSIKIFCRAKKTLSKSFELYKPCKEEWFRVKLRESKEADIAEPPT